MKTKYILLIAVLFSAVVTLAIAGIEALVGPAAMFVTCTALTGIAGIALIVIQIKKAV